MSGPIRIRGHLTGWTGYGQIAEWLGRGLESHGHRVEYEDYGADLRWLPQQDFVRDRIADGPTDGWIVHLASPNHVYDRTNPTICFTMWEASGLPKGAVPMLNGARAVVVPCRYNLWNFRACGVTARMHLCPLGISPGEGYTPSPIPEGGPTVFGMAARLTGGGGTRKGINEGIWAFLDAFPADPDVELRVKLWPDCVRHVEVPGDPRVKIDTTPMLPRQMANWYHGITCLFVPSRGEGWGLHTHQAMACGRPVIACKYSGTAEFFDGRHGWELEYSEVAASGYYAGAGQWAVASHWSMVDTLRRVHASRGECITKGELAAHRARQFTWDRTAGIFENILQQAGALPVVAEPATRPSLLEVL
jgi:glycosyltransferase involved in cell wall biosynthesis